MIFYAPFNKDLGLFCIRVGLGLIFITHGWTKLMGGPEMWAGLGANAGLTILSTVWGLLAASIEFFGGISLLTGFCVRYAAALMVCVMLMALVYHFKSGDGFATYSHPLSLLFVFIGLMISGAGSYSVSK